MNKIKCWGLLLSFLIVPLFLGAQNDQVHRTLKRKVAIGRFSNETQYAKGLFYNKKNDPMAKQAFDILSAKLAESDKFLLLERGDLNKIVAELNKGGGDHHQVGADFIILGSVTEFGRKNIGKQGLFTNTKSQIVQAGVSIRLVDVSSGLIIYADEAKGEAQTTSKSTLGFGGKAGYDASLSDKAISAAISKLVDNIIVKCTNKPWKSFFLSFDEDAIIMSGGASQDIITGDEFVVIKKGKRVKNPQNGLYIDLPGKKVATLEVISTGGDTPETEYSIMRLIDGNVDSTKLSNYIIQEYYEK